LQILGKIVFLHLVTLYFAIMGSDIQKIILLFLSTRLFQGIILGDGSSPQPGFLGKIRYFLAYPRRILCGNQLMAPRPSYLTFEILLYINILEKLPIFPGHGLIFRPYMTNCEKNT